MSRARSRVCRHTSLSPTLARTYSATWVFLACLLLGYLAKRITAKDTIGLLVAVLAILLLLPALLPLLAVLLGIFASKEFQSTQLEAARDGKCPPVMQAADERSGFAGRNDSMPLAG